MRMFIVALLCALSYAQTEACSWVPKYGHFVKEGHRDANKCFDTIHEAKIACEEAGDCFAISSQPDVCDGHFRIAHGEKPTFLHYEGGLSWYYDCENSQNSEKSLPVFSQRCKDCGCANERSSVDFEFLGNASTVGECIHHVATTDFDCGPLIMFGFNLCFCRKESSHCNQIKSIGWTIYTIETCGISLVKEYSEGKCEYLTSYGCLGSHMFVSNNCSALFEYQSRRFQCLHDGQNEIGHCLLPKQDSCVEMDANDTFSGKNTCHRVSSGRPCHGFFWGDACHPEVQYEYDIMDYNIPSRQNCEELKVNVVFSFSFRQSWAITNTSQMKVVITRWSAIEDYVTLNRISEDVYIFNMTIRNLSDIIQPLQLIAYLPVTHQDKQISSEIPFIDSVLLYGRLVFDMDCSPPVATNPWELDIGAKISAASLFLSEGYVPRHGGMALGEPIRIHLWIKSSVFPISEKVIYSIEITVGYRHSFVIYHAEDSSLVHEVMAGVVGCCTFDDDIAPRPEGRGEESRTWLLYLDPLEFTPLIADNFQFTMKITFYTVHDNPLEVGTAPFRHYYEVSTSVPLLPFRCELLDDQGFTYVAEVGSFARIPCKNADGYALMYCDVIGWNHEMSRVYCDIIEVVLPLSTPSLECDEGAMCVTEEPEMHYNTTYTLLMLICILAIFIFCSLLGIFHAKVNVQQLDSAHRQAVRRRPFLPLWLPHTFKYKRPNADENDTSTESKSDDDTPICYICLNKMYEDDFFISLPCKHRFHTHCLSPWLHAHTRYNTPESTASTEADSAG